MNREITNLSVLVLWLGVIIEVSVLGWLVFRIIRYRSNIMQLIEQKGNEIYILLISLFLVMGCYYIFLGSINDDEGYYLYMGKLVYSGKLPYVDFNFSQPPLSLYIHGIPQIIFGPSMYTGRATSLFFGLLTLIFTAKLAERFGGRVGAIIALGLISFNPYTIYYYTIVKAEVLTAFFMVLSLYFLFRNTRLKNPAKSVLSVSSMWLSVGSKLSAFPAVILLMLYIVYSKRKDRRTVLLSVGTGISVGVVLFVPFLIMAGDAMSFAMIGFYLGQGSPSGGTTEFGIPNILENIVGTGFSNVYQNKIPVFLGIVLTYLPILVLMSMGAIPLLERIRHPKDCDAKLYFLYILVVSVFAFHFFKTEVFIHHQGVILPVAAVLAGYGFAEMCANLKDNSKHILLTTASFLILAGLLAQTYVGGANADFSGNRTPIEKVEEMANYIKNTTPLDGKMLTVRATYTAVQANRQVLPGFEGMWGAYQPWSDELVEKYHVINKNVLHNYIRNGNASAILVTDFDRFYIIQPDGLRLIEERYYLAKTVQFYGQAGENAYLYLPKDAFISIEKFQVKQGDSQTWSGRVRPDAEYSVTLRWPGNAVVVGSGKADTTGQVSGSFLVGSNVPSGPVTLQIASDQSAYEEKTFLVGESSGSVSLVVVESHINYGAAQIWAAKGLPPYASYVLTLKLDGATLVLSGGNADENGDASGSFGVGTNIPKGENFLQIDVPSYPSYSAQTSFVVG